ncbi:MAG: TraR/DksA family transcriptional regulator [Chitinophagaceae bacterium]
MADDADRAQAQAEWLEEYRRTHRRKHTLRISDDCIECGERIDPVRIKALPHAVRCIDCQQELERIERQYG